MSFQVPGSKIYGLTIPGADLDTQILIPAPKPKGAGGIITISGLAQPFMQGRTKIASGHIESTLYAHASGKHRLAYDPDGNHVLKFGTIPCGDTLLSIVGTKMILYHIAMIVAQGIVKIHPYQQAGFLSDIYKGAPSSQQTIAATTAPAPSLISQIAGLGTAGLAAYNLTK